MENTYRIKYKVGESEVEVESTDKNFVETKFDELIKNIGVTSDQKETLLKDKLKPKRKTSSSEPVNVLNEESGTDIMSIVNAIKESDEYNIIEEKIIKKSDQLHRILLVFYFAYKINSAALISSGDVEKVTDQLGVRIKINNVATLMKKHQKYFTANSVRKRGTPTKYKINLKGRGEVDQFLSA